MAEKEGASETFRTFNTSLTSKHMCICRTLKGIMFSFPTSQNLQIPIHFTQASSNRPNVTSLPLVLSYVQLLTVPSFS